ncbi:MAG: ABC transporter permease [Candidatus Diapherotrites archaeon]|nr:ABC transporter permease [Candidatus Diapherotrites archaeon]
MNYLIGVIVMKLIDLFRLSVNSILKRRLRAWLTLLGIIIGVGAFVSIVSIGTGASANISDRLNEFGADVITISAGSFHAGAFGGGFRGPERGIAMTASSDEEPELTKRDVTVIKGNSNVLMVNEIVSGRADLVYLSKSLSANIQGVNSVTWTEFNQLNLDSGRFLSASDSSSVVIGKDLAEGTFTQPITIGRRISIDSQPFTVVGILTEGRDIYMPYTSAWNVTDVNINIFSSIQAKTKSIDLVEETTEQLEKSLRLSRKVTEKTQDFSVSSSLAMQETVSETINTLTLFLAAIAAVSLIVGAVGIANSMFTSVLEKTKEIGIMKALGSTNGEIMKLFLIESALFGLTGGIIGIALGLILSMGLQSLLQLNTSVSLELMMFALIVSILIGVISGALPANSASKLKPIEALRYE